MRVWHAGVKVERVGPTKVRFTCPRGHSTVVDYGKGPVAKRIPPAGLDLLLRSWAERVTHTCRKCDSQHE